ncbi:hypothetical protein [Victivallis sp. Marseille-Q1083]|uniref:hypothetical protein n=1 Tax=Victivallis sp. Marseille-Q1083 TaxID=2717288 RepID=UPI0015892A7D|nr:hypothetical protein [Victivallis sp. Marseille-Q1083]
MKLFLSIAMVILAILLLLIGIGLVGFEETPLPEILTQTPPLPELPAVKAVSSPAGYDLLEMTARSLFDPLRGKAKPATAEAENAQNQAPKFILVGICMMDDGAGAIIEKMQQAPGNSAGEKRYFKTGDEVADGFILNEVGESGVTLKRDNERLELAIGRTRFGEQAKKFQISLEQQAQADKQPETLVAAPAGSLEDPPNASVVEAPTVNSEDTSKASELPGVEAVAAEAAKQSPEDKPPPEEPVEPEPLPAPGQKFNKK